MTLRAPVPGARCASETTRSRRGIGIGGGAVARRL
jgi:hypothetical protein